MLHLHPRQVAVLLLLQPAHPGQAASLTQPNPRTVGRRRSRHVLGIPEQSAWSSRRPTDGPKESVWLHADYIGPQPASGQWPVGQWDPHQGCLVPGPPPVSSQPYLFPNHDTSANNTLKSCCYTPSCSELLLHGPALLSILDTLLP